MADSTVTDVTKMKVIDLRKELKSRGLVSTGDKAELVARLQAALAQDEHADINLDSDEIDSDGVLEDDDDKSQNDIVLDDSAVELALADNSPPKQPEPEPKPVKAMKRKFTTSTDTSKPENKDGGPKKIVLNRPTLITAPSETKVPESAESKPAEESTATKEKVKITADIDPKTRLEMRAKRFGLPVKVSDDERKEARKLRFGQGGTTAATTPLTTSAATTGTLSENLEKLKKRAERFGQSVSKIMTDIEKKELLEKRKEKFGLAKA